MERNGEQQTSKVLRSDRTRAKEAQQRNARMGQASGGDREDSGGLVRRSHVLTAKHSKRASLAARKKRSEERRVGKECRHRSALNGSKRKERRSVVWSG